ncbi:MAG: L,D-transpeptidase [Spartobacteria bacterium]
MKNLFVQIGLLGPAFLMLTGCNTLTEMVEANIPNRESGRPSIVISLRAQEAYLYRGKVLVASSRISSGREGHRTPIGRFRVTRKDLDHTSSLYGDYVSDSGRVVRANIDTRRVRKPPHTHYEGAPMPFFLEFSPGYGLHQGYLPGEPASHGCIRLPYWKARQFYNTAQIGTPVVVKP